MSDVGTRDGFRHIGEQVVHHGHVWTVVRARFEAPDGERFERDVVRSPGAVAVVALLDGPADQPLVSLVRQYRPPYGREIYEIPAGVRDIPGEPVTVTGHRELVEEVGLDAASLEPLADIYPSPGMTDSVISILLATDCTRVATAVHGPEERHMVAVEIPLDEALAMIDRAEISDAKTVTGLLMTQRRLRASG